MQAEYDAVVIGAGHNGLVSALRLADRGWKVLVLEKASQPGGASKSSEITEPGFQHDLYSMNIGLFLGSQFYQKYGDEMKQNGFDITVNEKPYASVFPDGTGIAAYQEREKMHNSLAAVSKEDAVSWEALQGYFDKTTPHFMPLMQMKLPSMQALKHITKSFRNLKWQGMTELGSRLLQSPREFVQDWFSHDKTQALIVPWGFHLDFAPDVSNGAVFPFLESILNQRNGMAFSKGGIQNMINSIAAMIEKRGGHVKTDTPVQQVLINDKNKAYGVKLDEGQLILARKAVIGNITPTQLSNNLVDKKHLPMRYTQKTARYRYGPGTMMIHASLEAPLKWEAGSEYSEFAYIHIGPYLQDLARTYTQAMNGELPDSPLLVVGQPDTADATRSPEGRATLWIQVRALPYEVRKDALGEINPAGWGEIKEQMADRVIEKLAQYAPNAKEVIRHRKVLSPADLEADNPNLQGGDSVSGSHHLFQNYIFRPFAGYSTYKTPVQHLYMTGASTWPGGGLNATSGWLLAEELK